MVVRWCVPHLSQVSNLRPALAMMQPVFFQSGASPILSPLGDVCHEGEITHFHLCKLLKFQILKYHSVHLETISLLKKQIIYLLRSWFNQPPKRTRPINRRCSHFLKGKCWPSIVGGVTFWDEYPIISHYIIFEWTLIESLNVRWLNLPFRTWSNRPNSQVIGLVESSFNG